jgi:ABC-type glutathione transport system ATPase component
MSATATPDALAVTDMSKSFLLGHERIAILSDISLEVHHGEFVALMGPSGSGKFVPCKSCATNRSCRLAGTTSFMPR